MTAVQNTSVLFRFFVRKGVVFARNGSASLSPLSVSVYLARCVSRSGPDCSFSQTGLYPLRRSRPDSPGPDRSVLRAAEKVLRSRCPVKPERIRYNNNNSKAEVCVSGARAVIRSRERSESSPSPGEEENTQASVSRLTLASPASHRC